MVEDGHIFTRELRIVAAGHRTQLRRLLSASVSGIRTSAPANLITLTGLSPGCYWTFAWPTKTDLFELTWVILSASVSSHAGFSNNPRHSILVPSARTPYTFDIVGRKRFRCVYVYCGICQSWLGYIWWRAGLRRTTRPERNYIETVVRRRRGARSVNNIRLKRSETPDCVE